MNPTRTPASPLATTTTVSAPQPPDLPPHQANPHHVNPHHVNPHEVDPHQADPRDLSPDGPGAEHPPAPQKVPDRSSAGAAVTFYLGTHRVGWLGSLPDVPLLVPHHQLSRHRGRLPRARTDWVTHIGGYAELSTHGHWATTPRRYAAALRRYSSQIGRLAWAAQQSWGTEPEILAKTGLSVDEHQQRTVANLLTLRDLAGDELHIIPVLHGHDTASYLRAADAFEAAGIDLAAEPVVGVASVAHRQHTPEVQQIFTTLAGQGLALHGFGIKHLGLRLYGHALHSCDSRGWSLRGRYQRGCTPTHRHEGNCRRFALQYRSDVLASIPTQPAATDGAADRVADRAAGHPASRGTEPGDGAEAVAA